MYQFVIPLHHVNWSTKSILEGISHKYNPKDIFIITSPKEIVLLNKLLPSWNIKNFTLFDEEVFFSKVFGLNKKDIIDKISTNKPNYSPGWLYQQLLKLGASDVIKNLDDKFLIWDADLLPVESWPLIDNKKTKFALLQDKSFGNLEIINSWSSLIKNVLGIEPVIDKKATFTSHHMFFEKKYLSSLKKRIQKYYNSKKNWIELLILATNTYGSMGEYWIYASWVNSINKNDLNFYPYEKYGKNTERFYDDGNGLFSISLKQNMKHDNFESFYPSYLDIISFLKKKYKVLPSSISFETNPRHILKKDNTMHVEELRSIWRKTK